MRPWRLAQIIAVGFVLGGAAAPPAAAQEPPAPIPLYVFDLHATIPNFPDTQALADSRGLELAQLPGVGLGAQAGLHFYPLRWRKLTIGLGGEVTANRARQQAPPANPGLNGALEKFLSASPQLSFNFGNANGWS